MRARSNARAASDLIELVHRGLHATQANGSTAASNVAASQTLLGDAELSAQISALTQHQVFACAVALPVRTRRPARPNLTLVR